MNLETGNRGKMNFVGTDSSLMWSDNSIPEKQGEPFVPDLSIK
jgi:hypothetical protein